jgi:hypothetical protein
VVVALSVGRKAAVVADIPRATPTPPLGLVAELLFPFHALFQPWELEGRLIFPLSPRDPTRT